MFKAKIKGLCVFLVVVLLISGCSPSSESNGSNGGTEDGKTVLTVWWNMSKGEDRYGYYDMINKYMEENPNIKIETQVLPYDQLKQKIITSANSGNPPDVAWGLGEWIADFYQMGILTDLTNDVNQWDQKSKISESVWSGMKVDGKIVGMPLYVGLRAQLYHADMLKEAGVQEPPQTWDQLIKAGQKLKESGVKYPYGLSGTTVRASQELAVHFWSNNVKLVEEMSGGKYRNTWNDSPENLKKATEVFAFYKEMMEKGVIAESEASWGWQELDTNFAQGKVAITMNGAWMKSYIKKNKKAMEDVKVAGYPVYNESKATFLEVPPAFTFKDSEHKKEAIKFMKWVSSKEAQKIFASNRSVRTDVQATGMWGEGFTKLVENGETWPPVPMGGITKAMQDSLQKVLIGGTSPEETAKWLAEQINQSLEENGLLGK